MTQQDFVDRFSVRIEYYHDNSSHPYKSVNVNRGCGVSHLRVVEFVRAHTPTSAKFGDYGILIDDHNGITHYPVTLDIPRLRAV